jgi:hypothetical protein
MVVKMIDVKTKLHCTDNGKDVDAHVLNYRPKALLEVAFQTLKIRMVYKENTRVFFGSIGGREFVIKEDDLPKERKDFQR